jgi:hypothetical protein
MPALAQKNISSAEKNIGLQQIPAAKQELQKALEYLNAAMPDYRAAFSYASEITSELASGNLEAHYLDLKKVKELQKKIEEL